MTAHLCFGKDSQEDHSWDCASFLPMLDCKSYFTSFQGCSLFILIALRSMKAGESVLRTAVILADILSL